MMAFRVLSCAVFLLCLSVEPLRAEDKPADAKHRELQRLAGAWKVDWLELDGERRPPEGDQVSLPLVIRDNEIRHGETKLSFTIDPGTDPKVIDVTDETDSNQAQHFEGIYKLGEDTLTICLYLVPGAKQRPVEFTTRPESKLAIFQFRRVE